MGLFASRETGLRWFGVVWRWFGVVWWWFGANTAGLRNTNAFKFILQVFILSQKHILGVKKVVWCGLDVVWGGLEVVWGGLGCFGVVWGVSTDRKETSSLFPIKMIAGLEWTQSNALQNIEQLRNPTTQPATQWAAIGPHVLHSGPIWLL